MLSLLALGTACTSSSGAPKPGPDTGMLPSASDAAVEPKPADAGTDAMADAAPPLDAGHDAGRDAGLDAGPDAERDADSASDGGDTSDAAPPSYACPVPAPAACPTPAPRYPAIAAIIKQRCASCHSPLWTGPWPLDTYGHVADWQVTIQANLLDCTMPPPDAGVPITAEERVEILTWIKCGLPQ